MAVEPIRYLVEVSRPTADELMRLDDAAADLHVTPKAVRAYIRRGWLVGHRVYDPETKRYKTAVTKASVAAMKAGGLIVLPTDPA